MRSLATALKAAGYPGLAPWYGLRRSMPEIIDYLNSRVARFAAAHAGPVHFVTHSLGGLVARALITAHRPERLGRVVMLGPPHAGSELADLMFTLGLDGAILGPVGPHLRTGRTADAEAMLGTIDYPLGIIAGDRPMDPVVPRLFLPSPNDGKVAVAATRIAGMADHIVLPVQHTMMVHDRRVMAQTVAFIRDGRFAPPAARA